MQQKITLKDNIYLVLPFIIMFILYGSSTMTYETQSLVPTLENLLQNKPLYNLLSKIEFMYADSIISIQEVGYYSFIEFFIRKGAHFFSFFLIGFFWCLGLKKRVRSVWLTVLLSIMLSIGYASFDELRQTFNPERSGLMIDVILDTVGAVVGITTAYFLTKQKIIK